MNGVLTGETGADFIGLFAAAPDKNVTNHYITFHFIHTLHFITLHYGTLQYANMTKHNNLFCTNITLRHKEGTNHNHCLHSRIQIVAIFCSGLF